VPEGVRIDLKKGEDSYKKNLFIVPVPSIKLCLKKQVNLLELHFFQWWAPKKNCILSKNIFQHFLANYTP